MTIHHYVREVDGQVARYHLRIERDGAGLLLANATAALRLSPSGVVIARRLLEGAGAGEVAAHVARAFRGAARRKVEEDVARVTQALDALVTRADRYPLRDMDGPETSVYRRTLSAPLRADVGGDAGGEVDRVLRALWNAGVPQVVFAIPDQAARERATRWVELAGDLGMITGVRARASILGRPGDLAAAGLDYAEILWAGNAAGVHDAIAGDGDFAALEVLFADVRGIELCAAAWVPLIGPTFDDLDEIAEAAVSHGARAMTVAAIVAEDPEQGGALAARALPQAAALAEEVAERLGVAVTWAPPTEREPAISIAAQVLRGPRSVGDASVRVTTDGAVLPPTGPATPAGNILRESWDVVWGRAPFRGFREATDDPSRCDTCPGLASCGIGCPRDPSTWARPAGGAK